jgi:hypothetical protein
MIKDDLKIQDLMYGNAVKKLADMHNIGLTEARLMLSQMSFKEYSKLSEASAGLTPPSGSAIGPSVTGTQPSPVQQSMQKSTQPANGPKPGQPNLWSGKGPMVAGSTVGVRGPDGNVIPGEVQKVNDATKGVTIIDPQTGQPQDYNMEDIVGLGAENQQPTMEDVDLARLLHLAGIKEDCSAGATGAGGIAVAAKPMGKVQRRADPIEEGPSLEHPEIGTETIAGDTKPSQASGRLSANLAVRGKNTASRRNNGKKV